MDLPPGMARKKGKRMKRHDLIPVNAAGGLIYRRRGRAAEPEVVMIYRWGKWDLPKGKQEEGESAAACAVREVREELGIADPEVIEEIASSYHEYERDGMLWGKTTRWFAMKTPEKVFSPLAEEDIEDAQWIALSQAEELAGYESLRPVLQKMRGWLQKKESNDFPTGTV